MKINDKLIERLMRHLATCTGCQAIMMLAISLIDIHDGGKDVKTPKKRRNEARHSKN